MPSLCLIVIGLDLGATWSDKTTLVYIMVTGHSDLHPYLHLDLHFIHPFFQEVSFDLNLREDEVESEKYDT
jgi:hypothetical protein